MYHVLDANLARTAFLVYFLCTLRLCVLVLAKPSLL
jgi:hypothetical protein